jgi:cell envelope opacity-associated protein A
MISVLLALALVTDPASAAGKAANEATATAEAPAPVEEKKICKRMEATESRVSAKRICKTAAEWKKYQRELDSGAY